MSTASRRELVQSLKIATWRWLDWPKARLGSRRNKCDWNSLLLTRVLNYVWRLDEANSNDMAVYKKEWEWEESEFFTPVPLLFSSLTMVAHWPHFRHYIVCKIRKLAVTEEIRGRLFPQMKSKRRRWRGSCLPSSQTAALYSISSAGEPFFKDSMACSWANWTSESREIIGITIAITNTSFGKKFSCLRWTTSAP